jgi:hemolysin activation/secretion protein
MALAQYIKWASLLTISLWASAALSQAVPPSAEPGRVLPPTRPSDAAYDVRPVAGQATEPSALTPEEAAKPIYVRSVTVVGATAISKDDLASYYADIVNTQTNVGAVAEVAKRIRHEYMDRGFSLSKIMLDPESLKTGDIRIDVLEAYVGAVDVDAALGDASIVRAFVAEIEAMRPLNTKRLERLMLVLNARPGLGVVSVLSSPKHSDAAPGEVTLTLQPRPQTLPFGFVQIDNDGSRFAGPFKVTLGGVIRNLGFNYDDLFISAAATTQIKEMRQLSAEYTRPVFGVSGALLRLSANTNHTEPGRNLADLDVKGRSSSVTADISYPILLQRDENWIVNAGLMARNAETDILATRLFDDRLRMLQVGSTYRVSDAWQGTNALRLNITKGLDRLGARETGSPDLSRIDGRSDFFKTNLALSRMQPLTPRMELFAAAQAQHTNHPLLSSEEFGVGGNANGRGYDPSEISGDKGVSASLELRYNHQIPAYELGLQPYGFYDAGKVWNIDPTDKNHASLASAGVGVRVSSQNGWDMDASAALPLTRAADEPPGYGNGNSPRFLISVRKSF